MVLEKTHDSPLNCKIKLVVPKGNHPTLQQATADLHLCQRLLGTHGQVWVRLLCVFLLWSMESHHEATRGGLGAVA